MKLHCGYEGDVLDAIAARRWPLRADAELRAHVASCELCADLAEVALAFLDERHTALGEGSLPSSSAVWWRSQIRAREEAARLAARPFLLLQIVATLCAAAASIAVAPTASAWVRASTAALGAREWWSIPPDGSLPWILAAAAYTALPLLAVGIWVVLAPVVVYLALDD